MLFANIPGLDIVKERLIHSAKSGKIPHAQLFQGSEGALNLPLALAYTTYLHCQVKGDKDACGSCPACSKSLKFIHPDTNFVFPSGNLKADKDEDRYKAERLKTWRAFLLERPFGNLNDWVNYYGGEDKQVNISKEESREIIRSLSLKSFESEYKVMIIWQPEYMHPSAANGILKILEEPPPNTIFLLVTNDPEQLLPTIVSRTQSVQVPMVDDEALDTYLLETQTLDEARRKKIVQLAEGSVTLALALLDTGEDNNQEVFSDWMRACFKKDYVKLVGLSEAFHELDKLSQRNLLHYSLTMMREVVLQLAGASQISRAMGSELKFIQDFSRSMNTGRIEKASQWINDAGYFLERNGSAKMIFLDLSLQISKAINP
jgi:DNA polymerase-3 subunit delta'